MRTTYPESLAWSLDVNEVKVENLYGEYPIQTTMAMTITHGGGSLSVTYTGGSEIGLVIFSVKNIAATYMPCRIDFVITSTYEDSNGSTYTDTFTDKFRVVPGKTWAHRHHASVGVITYEDTADLNGVEVLKPQGWTGNIVLGNNISTQSNTDARIVPMVYNSGQVRIRFNGTGASVYRGDVFAEQQQQSWQVRLVQVCPPRDGIKLTYYDSDGCKRYAIGRVLDVATGGVHIQYGTHADEIVQHRHIVSDGESEISVGFADVEPLQYLEDIMISPSITAPRGTGTAQLTPTSAEVVRDGDTKDIIITFKID